MRHLLIILILGSLLASCDSGHDSPSLNGTWKSIGSGWLLHIEDSSRYEFYDYNDISCLSARNSKLDELGTLVIDNDTLLYKKGVLTYQFVSMPYLPDTCTNSLSEELKADPIYNFEVFAQTVAEHYAFFELNFINWDSLYTTQKNKLSPASTDAELYLVIEETLELLKDNHAYLEARDQVYEALEQLEISSHEENVESNILPEYGDFQVAQMVSKHHMVEEKTKDSWLIEWGKLTDSIGFIQIKAMWLYANLDIPQPLIEELGYVDAYVTTFSQMYEGDYIEKEVEGVRSILKRVMNDLKDLESIVLDIRFNGGGQDAVSFEILRHFSAVNQQIATQKLRHKNGFSPTQSLYIESSKQAYLRPVYVLTSPQTGSAAEALAIATISMDHVYRIGSRTAGAMSTALEKILPNGWKYSISNEIYMDNKGSNYENHGIPVDIELDYPVDRQTFFRYVVNDLENDKQKILNAIKELNK